MTLPTVFPQLEIPDTLAPVQVRIGILNQLSEAAITDIVTRFAQAMNEMQAGVDIDEIRARMQDYYRLAKAA